MREPAQSLGAGSATEDRPIGAQPNALAQPCKGQLVHLAGIGAGRLSEDHGKTWSPRIVLHGKGITGDLGYPSTVQFDDGSLLTVWYERMQGSPNAVLRQARWSLEG